MNRQSVPPAIAFLLLFLSRVLADSEDPSSANSLACRWQCLEGRVEANGLWLNSTVAGSLDAPFSIRATGVVRSEGKTVPFCGNGTVERQSRMIRWLREGVVEEFTAGMNGVRQDFLLLRRPDGEGVIRLQLQVAGAKVKAEEQGVKLTLPASGRELAYSRLQVTDASGRELPAAFEVSPLGSLSITVDDSGAVWPLRVDPTVASALWVSMNDTLPGVDLQLSSPTTKRVLAVATDGTNVYIGGQFTRVGNVAADNIAKWNGTEWSPLGSGTNGAVSAIALDGTNVYAGGNFFDAGGVDVGNIARWDGVKWNSVGGGIGGGVFALAVSEGSLYAGGGFTTAGMLLARGVARWDGTSWNTVGGGIPGVVNALTVSNGKIYAGGNFDSAGSVTTEGVACWDGTSWTALGGGLTGGIVFALAADGDVLYAGGTFGSAGASRVAKWNGTAWSPLGAGMDNTVYALAVSDGTLYAGGIFTQAGTAAASLAAKWNGSNWQALGFTGAAVYAMTSAQDGRVTAGGSFTEILNPDGPQTVRGLAQWDGDRWEALARFTGPDNQITSIAADASGMYVAGPFKYCGSVLVNGVARWNGVTWSALGSGIGGGYARKLAVVGNDLYAAGTFSTAGGEPAANIARWDGSAWFPLGSGLSSGANTMTVDYPMLYVAGNFVTAGGITVNGLAGWVGGTWVNMGGDAPKMGINALAVTASGDLYAGGTFTSIGGVPANRIAKLSLSTWSALGTGIGPSSVNCLQVVGTDLYAGGNFGTVGGFQRPNIARWNGTAWSGVGSGLSGPVNSMTLAGGSVFVGGSFSSVGASQNFGRIISGSWSTVSTGSDGPISVMHAVGEDVLMGGVFSSAGGKPSPFLARYAHAAPVTDGTDFYYGSQGTAFAADGQNGNPEGVLGNDGDVTVAALQIGPAFGTLTLQPDGKFTFAAGPNAWGAIFFTYLAQGTFTTVTAANTASVWRYLNPLNGTDPNILNPSFNSTWKTASFNETGWGTASGVMGYGVISGISGTLPLTTDIGTPISGERRTAYFRRAFSSPSGGTGSLRIRLVREDAAIVYLNGVEILRSYEAGAAPEFPAAPDTWSLMVPGRAAAWTSEGDEEITVHEHIVPGVNLLAGTNQLAVSVHNNNNTATPTSSDLALKMELAEISLGSGGVSHTATLYIADAYRAPVLQDDAYATAAGVPLSSGGAVAGLYDNDGLKRNNGTLYEPILEAVAENAVHGTVTAFDAQTGSFTFTPAAGYSGPASFTYRVRDKDGWSAPAEVSVMVSGFRLFTRYGDHPTSVLTGRPALHSITPWQGRLYFGCGNYDNNPATTITSFDPADRYFHIEHSAGTDATDLMRVMGGALWVPHVDPAHFEDFKDFSWKRNGLWQDRIGGGWLHAYDMAEGPSGALYVVGSESPNNALLGVSRDGGITWTSLTPSAGTSRYYWCFELGGRIYCQAGFYTETSGLFTAGGPFTGMSYVYKGTKITPAAGSPFIVSLASRRPGESFAGGFTDLISFDGTTIRTLRPGVRDFAVDGPNLYVLDVAGDSAQIAAALNPTAAAAAFATVATGGVEPTATCLAAVNGNLYFGTSLGELYGSREDGQPGVSLGHKNDQPPAHGRGLAFHGTSLLVGSPDASTATTPLNGRATLFEEPDFASGEWTEAASITAPLEPYCSWLGKDVAIRGDLIAVLSPGVDETGLDRGANATVQLFYRGEGQPQLADTYPVPYAHSVGISPGGDKLVVSTANYAPSQVAGTPGLDVFTITRQANGFPQTTPRPQLDPTSAGEKWGYRPTTRVAFLHDLVIGAFSGDPSRGGGQGMVVAWKESTTTPGTYDPWPVWWISGDGTDRFAFSIAADGNWLVIGAPGNDGSVLPNRGAVHWYSVTPGNLPVPFYSTNGLQAGGEIGSALALSGRTLLLGGPGWTINGVPRGIVGEFHYNGTAWQHFHSWQAPANSTTGFGIELAIGDIWMAMASRSSPTGTGPLDSLFFQRRFDPQTGIDAWWAGRQPGIPLPALDSDADGDGWNLVEEYAWNLNPLARDNIPFTGNFTPSGGWAVDYTAPAGDLRLRTRVKTSENLTDWTIGADPPVTISTEGGRTQWHQPFPVTDRRFFRMEAEYRR